MADHESPLVEDPLAVVPLDIVSLVWQLLSATDRGSMRLACSQAMHLVDQVLTSATHDLRPLPGEAPLEPVFIRSNWSDGGGRDPRDREDSDDDEHGAADEAWRRTADLQSAFLSGLPRLQSLRLQRCLNEADLVHTLLRYDPAVLGRLTSVSICDGGQLSRATSSILGAACPLLQELTISRDLRLSGSDKLVMRGALFAPFHKVAPLTKLTISASRISGNALRSLVGLSRLRHLDLDVSDLHLHQLPLLSSLVSLAHLSVRLSCRLDLSLAHFSALFLLTHLTSLSIPSAKSYASCPGPLLPIASLDLLGGMTRLLALELDHGFDVDDAVFSAIRQLVQLTRLQVNSIQLAEPTSGHLPLLRELHIGAQLQPSLLLQTLLPLLPLPSLTALPSYKSFARGPCTYASQVSISTSSYENSSPPAVHVAALSQIAQHLAAAPHLQLPCAWLGWDLYHNTAVPEVTLHQLMESLQPLAGRLRNLTLFMLKDAAHPQDWGALATRLPDVEQLTFEHCELSEAGLAALVAQVPALTCLRLQNCKGVGAAGGWKRLAAACPRPLGQLLVYPADADAPPDLLARCGRERESAD